MNRLLRAGVEAAADSDAAFPLRTSLVVMDMLLNKHCLEVWCRDPCRACQLESRSVKRLKHRTGR